ncbi:gliding motility-associated ABC transporter substrate-binding protein GldG [Mucilaginibacter myungsuensis]|uniref:Gliding motility-associated ABC transporter substrate-binding protein GldG n=1 Tax=Mucilaginibacter myungsuensis TaxID=649104 RepID=A0A929PYH6_9SPHI|nr:gliding motility-associated ABC transporter substrate-binding protein GldG [Mucilaginibacter myungsuensis]MBE9664174.1 gliding motility-associated ABC transporter substrate-binding protein GldG [Mucilaginibacter myungsuensis]MDN3599877.1 gliding motility-associated ABC transporter substrate-binding protein GldG [Mucilaginibacter myungsuensis]
MYQVFKKEIISYLSSLVAYVTIGLFLLVLGLFLWVFPETSILDYGYAGLDSLFSIAPFLFMFLIPAITMRSLAEERKEGTFELLLTRPLTDVQIVLGKYFAAVLLLLCSLVPTFIYYWTVSILGSPQGNIDSGGVIGSYIGLFLLGGCFTAIGVFASSITKNQIIAFALAVFLCFFIFSGFDSLSGLLSLQDSSIQYLGISEHYQSVSRGVLDTRDLAYFIVLATLFIALTLLVLTRQRQKSINTKAAASLLMAMVALVALSKISFTRIDFTKEGRYTLSPVSRGIMDSLPKPVKVTLYLKGDNLPAGIKRLQYATRDMLNDLQAYSHGKLQFELVDPLKNAAEAEQEQIIQDLQSRGIEPTNLSVPTSDGLIQKVVFAGAMVSADGKDVPVNLLQQRMGISYDEQLNNSVQNLEYAFTNAISKAVSPGKGLVGISTGHLELNKLQMFGAKQALNDAGFDVAYFNFNRVPFDSLKKVSLVIIDKPDSAFNEAEKYKLDQYVMNGGRVLWAIDQVSAELDSMRGHGGEQMTFNKKLNLDDQLFTYGIRINYDLIMDMTCAQIPITTGSAGGSPQIQNLPWLFYPLWIPESKHPIVKNLEGVRSEFASTIDILDIKNVEKTVLLTSSPYNKALNTPSISLQMVEQVPNPKDFQSQPKQVAVLLEGSFKSAFVNRPVPEGVTDNITPLSASKPTKMVVISDGDIFKNQVGQDGNPYPLGYDRYLNKNFGNKNLLLNTVEYLTGDTRLISLRDKEIQLRLLNRPRIRNEKLYWQLINTAGPLAMVLIFAIFQHYLRRRKYAH